MTDPLERLYNRNYGVPNTVRRRILNDAEIYGVKDSASRHNVSPTTIYSWRRTVRAYEKGWDDAMDAQAALMRNA